ncbi:hypothetical protein C8R43DRAFT_1235282 [Mycena crocata]|nr:hypothetical protein C8R43DRAFT_1235282 [Mycena crocata]
MFLLLLSIYLFFAKLGSAQGFSTDSQAPADPCDDLHSCRRLFDIVWGCLATIFACTWVSIHPNVPAPDQSWFALLLRRLRLMLIAVIAPELMVGFAARQFFVARSFSKEFSLSRTHGFFFSMGGFASHDRRPIATFTQLNTPHGREYLAAIRDVKLADIVNGSKDDAVSKGVALAQGLWFITECLARVRQRLPITQLEVATLAFSVVTLFIRIFWWNKPLDVHQPILLGPTTVDELMDGKGREPWWMRFNGAFSGYYPDFDPTSSTFVPTFWSTDASAQYKAFYCVIIECFIGAVFGGIHCAAWNTYFLSTHEMWMWRSCALWVAALPVAVAVFATINLADVNDDSVVGRKVYTVVILPAIPLYVAARLFLIVLPLIGLRKLPPGALRDVDWSDFIPHL